MKFLVYRTESIELLIIEQFAFFDGKEYLATTELSLVLRRLNIQTVQITWMIIGNDLVKMPEYLDEYEIQTNLTNSLQLNSLKNDFNYLISFLNTRWYRW